MGARELVAGRVCGECAACCVTPSIDTAEIQKPSGVRCTHCIGNACGIYESRPHVCRKFYCAWRYLPALGDAWRPDRSGVLAAYDDGKDPNALTLTLIGNPLKTVREVWFQEFVRACVLRGQVFYIALPGPPGHLPARVLITGKPMIEAARRSAGRVKEVLEQALAFLKKHTYVPYVLKHRASPEAPSAGYGPGADSGSGTPAGA